MNHTRILTVVLLALLLPQCSFFQTSKNKHSRFMDSTKKITNPVYSKTDSTQVTLSDEEWKKILPSDVYYVARQKGTERPWTSEYETSKELGTYYCTAW